MAAREVGMGRVEDLCMSETEKPEGKNAGWERLGTDYPVESEHLKVRQDRVLVNGKETEFTYQEHPPSVIIVPVTHDGKIVLIRQYRYAVDAWSLEVPAGGTNDTGAMPLEDVARKELKEEVGGICETLEHVGQFFSSPAVSDETCHVYLARGVELSWEPELEETETVEVRPLPVADAYARLRAGEVRVGPSALALFLCEDRLHS